MVAAVAAMTLDAMKVGMAMLRTALGKKVENRIPSYGL
jgi:hypothetical protein